MMLCVAQFLSYRGKGLMGTVVGTGGTVGSPVEKSVITCCSILKGLS